MSNDTFRYSNVTIFKCEIYSRDTHLHRVIESAGKIQMFVLQTLNCRKTEISCKRVTGSNLNSLRFSSGFLLNALPQEFPQNVPHQTACDQ